MTALRRLRNANQGGLLLLDHKDETTRVARVNSVTAASFLFEVIQSDAWRWGAAFISLPLGVCLAHWGKYLWYTADRKQNMIRTAGLLLTGYYYVNPGTQLWRGKPLTQTRRAQGHRKRLPALLRIGVRHTGALQQDDLLKNKSWDSLESLH